MGSFPVLHTRTDILDIVQRALAEDLPWGDVTTDNLVPSEAPGTGNFVMREAGTICGLQVAALVFEVLDPGVSFQSLLPEGGFGAVGTTIARVEGPLKAILSGERTALNLIQRMSGIASVTARYVDAVFGTSATIVDTRKTAPGLRVLDKYAVRCGGGSNHRFCLSDGVLVKDNHLAFLTGKGFSVAESLQSLRKSVPHTIRIEVEIDDLDQLDAVLAGGADIVLLDNMTPDILAQAVREINGRAVTEASGGVTLDTVKEVAAAGVDLISVGALTHSVRALDISLDIALISGPRTGAEVRG